MEFIINWHLNAKQFHPAMVLVGADEKARNIAASYGLQCVPISWKTTRIDHPYSRIYGWYPKTLQIHCLATLVGAGYNVLLQGDHTAFLKHEYLDVHFFVKIKEILGPFLKKSSFECSKFSCRSEGKIIS